ncbi:venom dipeptidyl peptidase 4 [Drosophila nasuta]|uniref:Venom dipeptidyl peptidase 4 n=1 Tax=Drosophila albomicans TaxID=7291 RepID=A0A6P8W8D4_DROAB|nr:venom dipeptidyl peptidase 4 [Drosophila albomicans]XP_060663445.1 venom dipeptidyl peptidase 4 [Drosophila nasuta]
MLPIFKLLLLFLSQFYLGHTSIIKIQPTTDRLISGKTPWNLTDAIYGTAGLRSFNGTWITDEEFYYTASDKSIHKFNAATNTDTIFVDSSFLESYSGATFTLSQDFSKILVRYNLTEKFRHSYVAQYDIYDIATNSSIKIHKGEKLQYCGWSPLKDRLAYVYLNNVYIHFNENLEIPITEDGTDGIIYNGVPDWVYEEEVLSSGSALWWSPDGSKLSVGFFDDTNVETFKYFLYGDDSTSYYQYPHEEELKYPKTGTPNPIVYLRVYDLSNDDPIMRRINAPIDIVSSDHILQNVVWSNNSHLLITWMNRRQNLASIQSCSHDGSCVEVTRIEEPNGWVTISTPKCINDGLNCLFSYFIDNWYQVWNLNLQTGVNSWKSRGNFTVLNIYGYDEINDKLYYQATQRNNPAVYHVYSNDDCLSCNRYDVDNEECKSASATFSKSFSFYTLSCVGPNPIYTKIYEVASDTMVKDWELNSQYRTTLEGKLRPSYSFINVALADGSTGIAKLALPPNFDESKKYPMIVVVYGGPNSVRVTNSFTVGYEAFVTTKRDTIYAYIDGRGTGNKGKDLLFSVNNDLGDYEVEDQLYVTKWLQDNLVFIDPNRTGIWGWSYGGYMTAKTIEKDDSRVFQCGVSVAPVTSWLYYDTIYTERYMGLPTLEDNAQKYNESNAFHHLENFKTHDFLLVHGSGDDNVHYQHSLLLAKLLQKADIQFDEQTYTDENHSIGNALPHLYNTIDNFWIKCLNYSETENV